VRTLGGVPEAMGGISDHVHLLVGLRATHYLSDVMPELKSVSSRWVHEAHGLSRFAWQESYGAFPVSQSQRVTLRRYIENQEEHYRTRTFREEYLELLQRHGVEFDSRYVFRSVAPAGADVIIARYSGGWHPELSTDQALSCIL